MLGAAFVPRKDRKESNKSDSDSENEKVSLHDDSADDQSDSGLEGILG